MAFLLGPDGDFLLGPDGYFLTDGKSDLSTLDWESTLLSQYANSPVLISLMSTFSQAVDPSSKIDDFYTDVWNINTASGYGLDIWGRIVGVGRNLDIIPTGDFGFLEGAGQSLGFGPFYDSALKSANFEMGDDLFRTVILAKARANISGASAPQVNLVLENLFPGVRCYVSDTGGMTATAVFEAILSPVQRAILEQTGVVQRPAGVSYFTLSGITQASRFGFAEGGYAPFGSGTFSGDPVYAQY